MAGCGKVTLCKFALRFCISCASASMLSTTALSSTDQCPPPAPIWEFGTLCSPENHQKQERLQFLNLHKQRNTRTRISWLGKYPPLVSKPFWNQEFLQKQQREGTEGLSSKNWSGIHTVLGVPGMGWLSRKSRSPGTWHTNEGYMGEWNKTGQALKNWSVHGKCSEYNRENPTGMQISNTYKQRGLWTRKHHHHDLKAQLMAPSQRIRSGAALRPTLSSGSSDHIKSWFITTMQDSSFHYNHHNFPYPNNNKKKRFHDPTHCQFFGYI